MSTNRLSRSLACALLLSFPAVPCIANAATPDPVAKELASEVKRVGVDEFTAADYKPGTVRHVVLVRFRAGLTDTARQQIITKFLALQQQSVRNGKPYIESIDTGPQLSGEGASHGMQQAFIVTFSSQGDRNYFIGTPIVTDPHHYEPAHAAFKEIFKPALAPDGLIGFDFAVAPSAQ